jgi:hypothetical protein
MERPAPQMAPWISMWGHPRSTIRMLVQTDPKYGLFALPLIYGLENFLFFANWWSLGLTHSVYSLLLAALMIIPPAALFWLYMGGWFLQMTGRWLGGRASAKQLRLSLAWSKIPSVASIFMWMILLSAQPDLVFIQDGGGPSSLFINLITLILSIWSYLLLIQCLREVQKFSVGRSILNVLIFWLFLSFVGFVLFNFLRYAYLQLSV